KYKKRESQSIVNNEISETLLFTPTSTGRIRCIASTKDKEYYNTKSFRVIDLQGDIKIAKQFCKSKGKVYNKTDQYMTCNEKIIKILLDYMKVEHEKRMRNIDEDYERK
ncbi:unnamed protein product, partial [Meganyctiphanes norvegica]